MKSDLQSSIPRGRDARTFAYSLMSTKKSAQTIKTILIATTAGASDGGLMKFVVTLAGGAMRGISDKGT